MFPFGGARKWLFCGSGFFAAVALFTFALGHVESRSTLVSFRFEASEVAFRIAERSEGFRLENLLVVDVDGSREIRWPDGTVSTAEALRLESRSLSLEPLPLQRDDEIHWRAWPGGRREVEIRRSEKAPASELLFSASGSVEVEWIRNGREEIRDISLDGPRSLLVRGEGSSSPVGIAWLPTSSASRGSGLKLVGGGVEIEQLRLVWHRPTEEKTRYRSGLVGGEIVLSSVGDRAVDLGSGDVLRLREPRGRLETSTSGPQSAAGSGSFRFVGEVQGIDVGWKGPRSEMPSRLETLVGRRQLALILQILSAVLALLLGGFSLVPSRGEESL